MTWNYRVISHPSWNTWDKEGERIYKIHEVFSDETGIIDILQKVANLSESRKKI